MTSLTEMSLAWACCSFWDAKVAMMCSSLANLSASDSSTRAAAAASCSANLARFSFDFFLERGFPFAAFFASRFAFASACVESQLSVGGRGRV